MVEETQACSGGDAKSICLTADSRTSAASAGPGAIDFMKRMQGSNCGAARLVYKRIVMNTLFGSSQ